MAAILRAQFFNHVVDTDIYNVKWQGKKRRIQAIMDEFTRFEAEARIKRETVQWKIKGFEKLWLGWAGTLIVLRCDMSGAHMSDDFASCCDGHGTKLELIPKAHHKLAIQERNHAVRRNQLLNYEKMYPLDSLKKAIAYTLAARNRLRNVKGHSPIQRVLGFQPHIPATLSDADYRLKEQAAASDPTSSLSQDLERRREAQKAFLDANFNFQQSVRRSLLARTGLLVENFWSEKQCTVGVNKKKTRTTLVRSGVRDRASGESGSFVAGSVLLGCARQCIDPVHT